MENTLPKYMKRKNAIGYEIPANAPGYKPMVDEHGKPVLDDDGKPVLVKLVNFDGEKHYFSLVSIDYTFTHPVMDNGKHIATIAAIPCNIFSN